MRETEKKTTRGGSKLFIIAGNAPLKILTAGKVGVQFKNPEYPLPT